MKALKQLELCQLYANWSVTIESCSPGRWYCKIRDSRNEIIGESSRHCYGPESAVFEALKNVVKNHYGHVGCPSDLIEYLNRFLLNE